jgi:hypothetical protein
MDKAIELGSCLYTVVGAAVVAWGIWRAWTRPPQVDQGETIDLAERRQPSGWSIRGELARLFLVSDGPADMSSDVADLPSRNVSDRREWHQVPAPVFVSAKPNTDDTEPVPGATGASEIDTSVRDIIRASAIAELLDSGLLTNRDKAICLLFHCSKASSSRPEAPFQVALKLVEQHRAKARPEYVGEMIARVEREVAEEASR